MTPSYSTACSSRKVTVPGGQTSGVICLLLAFITVAMYGTVVTININRRDKKRHSSEATPNTQELQVDQEYEEMDTLQNQTIQLEKKCGLWTSETESGD